MIIFKINVTVDLLTVLISSNLDGQLFSIDDNSIIYWVNITV